MIDLIDRVGAEAFNSITRQISDDPYNPGSFAWGWQYHARGCLIMYNLTGQRKWLDWALNLTDHFLEYSDVNADGEPAWGNYNDTWGNSRYDFREYTVWDGVIGLPIVEAAKVIRGNEELSANASLSAKADAYVGLITRIIHRHHKSWTQVAPEQGYYWDDPNEDIGPIVNRFTALGRVELILGDVIGNISYYEKPRQMANYMIANMRYIEAEDLYTWDYWYGKGGSEDISHGAIELEFLIMASERGLLDELHIHRLCNTYLKRIWQVPDLLKGKHIVAMKVDGTDPPEYDYTRISRNWILLAPYNASIYDHQRTAFGILHERSGMYASSVSLLGLSQIPLMAKRLRFKGIDPDEIKAVDLDLLTSLFAEAEERLKQTMALGAEASTARSFLEEASGYINEEFIMNASVPIGLILKTWDMLGRMMETGKLLRELSDQVDEARELGVDVTSLETKFLSLKDSFTLAEIELVLEGIDDLAANLTLEVQMKVAAALIRMADEVLAEAKNMGIDTSRHEIFLMRAHEEFDKGNYGPARQFTAYPLRLKEELGEFELTNMAIFLILPLLLLDKKFIFIVGAFGQRRCG